MGTYPHLKLLKLIKDAILSTNLIKSPAQINLLYLLKEKQTRF